MRSVTSFIAVVALGLCLAAPSAASIDPQGRGNGRGQSAKPGKSDKAGRKPGQKPKASKPGKAAKDARKGDRDVDVIVVDRDGHARVIREYRGSLPPGLAKRQALPPGLRQQLAERGELPPGLRTYLVDVPAPWASRLPTIPSYYNRYFVGDDLIVVDTRTNRIIAIVRDVLR